MSVEKKKFLEKLISVSVAAPRKLGADFSPTPYFWSKIRKSSAKQF